MAYIFEVKMIKLFLSLKMINSFSKDVSYDIYSAFGDRNCRMKTSRNKWLY